MPGPAFAAVPDSGSTAPAVADSTTAVPSVRLSRLDRLRDSRLYLCTDARRERGDLAEFVDAALSGGVDIIQLRDKGSAGERRFGPLEAAAELAALGILTTAARRHGALVAVNDRADIAVAAGADLLHVGQDDLPPSVARSLVGPDVLLGLSTHDEQQAAGAVAAGTAGLIDYFCTGPCWPTPTKPGRSAPGLDLVRFAARTADGLPWFAIGGIDEARALEVVSAGADRIVVVRAITAAADPAAAARRLRATVSG